MDELIWSEAVYLRICKYESNLCMKSLDETGSLSNSVTKNAGDVLVDAVLRLLSPTGEVQLASNIWKQVRRRRRKSG